MKLSLSEKMAESNIKGKKGAEMQSLNISYRHKVYPKCRIHYIDQPRIKRVIFEKWDWVDQISTQIFGDNDIWPEKIMKIVTCGVYFIIPITKINTCNYFHNSLADDESQITRNTSRKKLI